MLKKFDVKRICQCGILAAIGYVVTIFISIPLSSAGYLNLSDMVISLTTLLFGPVSGIIVGSIFAGMADLTLGYYLYIPFTIVSKSLEVVFIHLVLNKIKYKWKYLLIFIPSFIMALVYVIPDFIVLGFNSYLLVLSNLLFNFIQGLVGIILSLVLYNILKKVIKRA